MALKSLVTELSAGILLVWLAVEEAEVSMGRQRWTGNIEWPY